MFKTLAALFLSLPVAAGLTTAPPIIENGALCHQHEHLLGATDHDVITICPDNIAEKGQDEQRVIRHEIVHVIHYNFGLHEDETLLPAVLFKHLVREHVPSDEVLLVYTAESYVDYPNQEIEARLLSNLPTPIIMGLYWASEDYASTNPSN